MQLFKYDSSKAGYIGVEREAFIVDSQNEDIIVPVADKIYADFESKGIPIDAQSCFGPDSITWDRSNPSEVSYELSNCQIESRVGPTTLIKLSIALQETSDRLDALVGNSRLYQVSHKEIASENMPLDVYPDPTGRYQEITRDMQKEVLLAACRVAGTHVHIGMRDHESALRTYNYVIRHIDELCEVGNGSFGERLAIYRQMAPDYRPRMYKNWDEYYQYAVEKGFETDPRKCWTLIRISVHGTIEFRMFGATASIDRIVSWANRCHELCQMAMMEA
jgi:gamma-glutamyl:cysteine ligase YbdK (ATP-grasp superfamily)